MLYVTTRSERDAFTAHRTLCTNRAPDNGCFIPLRFPRFSKAEICSLLEHSFEEVVAHILNVFFSAGLTKWDVGLYVGRNTARIFETSPRICFAELWHNPGNCFEYVVNGLFCRIYGKDTDAMPTEWFRIAVKVAVLFGLYGELCHKSLVSFGDPLDMSLQADDFSYPVSALYASAAGLPLGNIVCNCVQTHEVWNLVHRGTLNVLAVPEKLKPGIERFLLLRLNRNMAACMQSNRPFEVPQEEKEHLRNGLFCVVSGTDRISHAINGAFSSNGLLITPDAALCVAGLGDYRAKTGESRFTLILEEDSPALFAEQIEKVTGISRKKLGEYLRE